MSSLFFSPLKVVGGTAVGVGVGGGIATVIEPILRELANEGWAKYQTMPLQAVEAAQVVASGERELSWGVAEAQNVGVSPERFQALVDMVDTAPDLGTLFDLLHRGYISEGEFREGARKGMIEPKWLDALVQLAQRVLSPAEAANAWQQGFMSEGEAVAEAELSGVSPARSAIQRELAGLPPGAMDGLTLLRRGIIDEGRYAQIVREGHTKTKYTPDLLALREHILPGREVASLWLRGWLTEAQAKQLGSLDGWGPLEMERLYQNRGRPATPRQMWLAIRRSNATEADFRTAIKQSNIRTEYTDWLWDTRFTYPSLFQLNRLVTSGAFTVERGREILWNQGWEEQDIERMVVWWGEQGEAPTATWVRRARTTLFNRVHTEYTSRQLTEAEAEAGLAAAGVPAAERGPIVALWTTEAELIRTELTQAQIVKAYKKGLYTEAEALAELQERGLRPEDATIRLQSG